MIQQNNSAADHTLSSTKAWLLMTAIAITMFTCISNSLAVITALPAMAQDLNLSTGIQTWLMVAFGLSTAALIMTIVQLANRFGQVRLFMLGQSLLIIASIMAAIAQQGWFLITARVIQGAAYACLFPTSLALIKTAPPKALRELFVVLWSGFQVLGGALGPLMGGLLTEYTTWRLLFWVNIGFSSLAFLLCLGFMNNISQIKSTAKLDNLGSLLLIIISSAVLLMLNQGPIWGWQSDSLIAFYVFIPILITLFFKVETKSVNPVLNFTLFKNIAFLLGISLYFTMGVLVYSINYFFNIFSQSNGDLHLSATKAGIILMAFNIPAAILSLLDESIIKKIGYGKPLLFGSTLLCTSLFLFWLTPNNSLNLILIKLLIAGIGLGIAYPVCTLLAMEKINATQFTEASGVINLANYLGSSIGISGGAICFNQVAGHLSKHFSTKLSFIHSAKQLQQLLYAKSSTLISFLHKIPLSKQYQLKNAISHIINKSYSAANTYLVIFSLLTLGLSVATIVYQHKKNQPSMAN